MSPTSGTSPDPYRRTARYYDRFIEPLNAGLRDVALRLDPPDAGWAVLDVGCGTGTGLARYGAAGCELFGVDVSPAMLARAKSRLGATARLQLIADTTLPFEDATFDLVTASMMVHEVGAADRDGLVGEMARVVKSGGHLLFTDFRFGSLRGLRGRATRVLTTAIERIGGHWDSYRDFRRAGGIPALLARNGLEVRREKITAGGSVGIYLANRAE